MALKLGDQALTYSAYFQRFASMFTQQWKWINFVFHYKQEGLLVFNRLFWCVPLKITTVEKLNNRKYLAVCFYPSFKPWSSLICLLLCNQTVTELFSWGSYFPGIIYFNERHHEVTKKVVYLKFYATCFERTSKN